MQFIFPILSSIHRNQFCITQSAIFILIEPNASQGWLEGAETTGVRNESESVTKISKSVTGVETTYESVKV